MTKNVFKHQLLLKLLFSFSLIGFSHPGLAFDLMKLQQQYEDLDEVKKQQYDDIANNLRCPTCTALSIQQSETPFALQLRSALFEQLQQNKNTTEIYDFFTERYGLWILRKPPVQGFHSIAWIFPIMFVALGAFLIWLFFLKNPKSTNKGATKDSLWQQQMLEELQTIAKEKS